ncbi:MAG TPA: hypothetical protein VN025_09230 [Candidatus Dormibacteraeota bacterium]|jgi:hypothetical protein|nr:hypothetical protein [Candidatus Dormibacteraeota bacterium]
MNRNPQFGSLPDLTATAMASRKVAMKERVILSVVGFLFLIGTRALFRWGMPTRGKVIEAALVSIFASFGVPALLKLYEHHKSVLVHKSLPLP